MTAKTSVLLGLILAACVFMVADAAASECYEYKKPCAWTCYCWTSCDKVCCDDEGEYSNCDEWGMCPGKPACITCDCSGGTINGTAGDDTLSGNSNNNCIYGLGGDDTLYGNAGDDKLYGGPGADSLFGGDGDDCLYGGTGNDYLEGESGSDYCTEGETYVSCND